MTRAQRVGSVLALIHAVAFACFWLFIQFGQIERSQGAFYWLLWMPIDLPWSWLGVKAAGAWSDAIAAASGLSPWNVWSLIMTISHGVIGTVWWFFVPQIVAGAYCRIASCKK